MFFGADAFGQSPFGSLPLDVRYGHRPITAEMEAASLAERFRPFLAAEIDTADGFIRAHSGTGDLVLDGETYAGVGGFYGIDDVEETTDLAARGIKVSLAGAPSDMLAYALGAMEQGREATIYLGLYDLATWSVIDDPWTLFRGLTDVPEIDENTVAPIISLSLENRLIDLERARVRRYTDEDQKIDDPTDKGFEYVPSLQDRQILFGKS